MLWIVGILLVVGVIVGLAAKGSNKPPTLKQSSRDARERGRFLPLAEQQSLAEIARSRARERYDFASDEAFKAGKDASFAHQVGVFGAVAAVLNEGSNGDRETERWLQMETIPFNLLDPQEGRAAVTEYLIWKFFPDLADKELLSKAIGAFKAKLVKDAETEPDGDAFIFNMLYSARYDWQRYAAEIATYDNPDSTQL